MTIRSGWTEHETRLDEADAVLLERLREPPMPGLEVLPRFVGIAT